VIPPSGVPTLPPRPSTGIGMASGCGATTSSDSSPRTQCGTITSWPRTFSSPSASSSESTQSIAASSMSEPLSRRGKRSTSSAVRS
jgi:hypothetical protein